MKAHLTFHPSLTVLLIRNEQISKNNDDIKIKNFDAFWFFQNFNQLFWLTFIYTIIVTQSYWLVKLPFELKFQFV